MDVAGGYREEVMEERLRIGREEEEEEAKKEKIQKYRPEIYSPGEKNSITTYLPGRRPFVTPFHQSPAENARIGWYYYAP